MILYSTEVSLVSSRLRSYDCLTIDLICEKFDRLVEELLPVLHVHFLRQGIKSSMYCSQWFLTLFSYRYAFHSYWKLIGLLLDSFPLEIVFRIYDSILANGIEAIFGFSIMLLRKNEDTLLTLKFDEILSFLNTKLFDCYLVSCYFNLQ